MFGPLGILSIAILAIASILLWRRKK
jgi:LPXTG-motif cell wall-anchored protein